MGNISNSSFTLFAISLNLGKLLSEFFSLYFLFDFVKNVVFLQCPDLDAVLVACSVGGLLGGMSKAFKEACPNIKVFGVEPKLADDLAQSFDKGERIMLSGE